MSFTIQALFYFLALACFVAAAFVGTGRRRVASRVDLIALGLAFWVFVPFWNAFERAS